MIETRTLRMDSHGRNPRGMSLVELLSAIFIMTFVGAAITELCASQNIVAFRSVGKMSGIINARRAIALFDRDVRIANSFPNSFTPTVNIPAENSVANWIVPSPSYVADYQTLILTQPVFDANGYASSSKTIIYKILADKRTPGKGLFVMQKKDFSNSDEPQTILTGIVGPISAQDTTDSISGTPPPRVFKPLIRLAELYGSTGIPSSAYPGAVLPSSLTKGVQITLEVFESATQVQSSTPKSIAFAREVYARGNYAVSP